MNGPCLRPSGSLLLPYCSRRRGTSAASRPDWALLSSRLSTSSVAMACQAVEPLWGVTFIAVFICVLPFAQFPVPVRMRVVSL